MSEAMYRPSTKRPEPFFQVDTDRRWREAAIPHRKRSFAHSGVIQIDYLDIVVGPHTRKAPDAGRQTIKTSRTGLVVAFGIGLVLLACGFLALLLSAFLGGHIAALVSAVLLALGSTTVAITLVRGQDLDGRTV